MLRAVEEEIEACERKFDYKQSKMPKGHVERDRGD